MGVPFASVKQTFSGDSFIAALCVLKAKGIGAVHGSVEHVQPGIERSPSTPNPRLRTHRADAASCGALYVSSMSGEAPMLDGDIGEAGEAGEVGEAGVEPTYTAAERV